VERHAWQRCSAIFTGCDRPRNLSDWAFLVPAAQQYLGSLNPSPITWHGNSQRQSILCLREKDIAQSGLSHATMYVIHLALRVSTLHTAENMEFQCVKSPMASLSCCTAVSITLFEGVLHSSSLTTLSCDCRLQHFSIPSLSFIPVLAVSYLAPSHLPFLHPNIPPENSSDAMEWRLHP
jgi:hypothetical protein